MSKAKVTKVPDLLISTPTQNTYMGLSQTELLAKVKALHEGLLKTNRYLMEMHKLSIYNWEDGDTGNIIVELSPDNRGFLLDAVLRLRGSWDPALNVPELLPNDTTKLGWLYKVNTTDVVELFGQFWKSGDYALYDEHGDLYNVTASMLASLFTPIIPNESPTIHINTTNDASGVTVQAHLKVDPRITNDLKVSPQGVYSEAFEKSKELLQVLYEAPTQDNIDGTIKIIYLPTLPEHMYKGYLYLVPISSL